jgi:RNA polymerase sigma-70 factor (ECF subfamily)
MTSAALAFRGKEAAGWAVRSARRGEPEGWDWLFDRYHRLVLRYTMARLGDADLAEDVTQEVFVAAVTAIHKLRDDSSHAIEGWLLGIARHKVADRRRRLKRDQRQPVVTAFEAPDAAELAVNRLSADEVRGALEQLSEAQREVILRRFILDESLEEVASSMRKPVGAVKSLQHRGLASLVRLCGSDGP